METVKEDSPSENPDIQLGSNLELLLVLKYLLLDILLLEVDPDLYIFVLSDWVVLSKIVLWTFNSNYDTSDHRQ